MGPLFFAETRTLWLAGIGPSFDDDIGHHAARVQRTLLQRRTRVGVQEQKLNIIRFEHIPARSTLAKSKAPRLFRVLLPARDLGRSQEFYETLLAVPGRRVGGGRVYFDCGSVILGLLDYSTAHHEKLTKPAEALYFSTSELEGLYRRASRLGCLAQGLVHDDPASPLGEIVVRPWGERSFYAEDPSGNPLCFVDEATLFTGTPRQVAALNRPHSS